MVCGLALFCGCASLHPKGADPAAVTYAHGELKGTESASLDRAWQASLDAVRTLGFGTTMRGRTRHNATIALISTQKTPVKIQLESLSPEATQIRIRVGQDGDEALSLAILERIQKQL